MHHIHTSTPALFIICAAIVFLVWLIAWAWSNHRRYKRSERNYNKYRARQEPETYYLERSTGGYKGRGGAVAPPMTPTTEQ